MDFIVGCLPRFHEKLNRNTFSTEIYEPIEEALHTHQEISDWTQ